MFKYSKKRLIGAKKVTYIQEGMRQWVGSELSGSNAQVYGPVTAFTKAFDRERMILEWEVFLTDCLRLFGVACPLQIVKHLPETGQSWSRLLIHIHKVLLVFPLLSTFDLS